MNLNNKIVIHQTFGFGIIRNVSGNAIAVEFDIGIKNFRYPDAFIKYLKAEDSLIQSYIVSEIKEKEKEIKENTNEKHSMLEIVLKNKKTIKRKPKIYFVFQGKTFDFERRGGYIWAPSGHSYHHWKRLRDIQIGDIILHGCNQCIQAISITKTICYECQQPKELASEGLWHDNGLRVDCEYINIRQPIQTAQFRDDIIRLCRGVEHSPFNKNGGGNQGYLYELNPDLARIFLNESIKKNPYLNDISYINEIIS